LLSTKGFSLNQIGIVAALYPAVWGIGQVITGKMADRICKKDMLVWGMILQAIALLALVLAKSFAQFTVLSILLGWGTAMVYPTFLAAIAENTHPGDRAKSLGVFRFWRDLGYAIGAFTTGLIADLFGISSSIIFVGILTLLSGLIIYYRMKCTTDFARMIEWLKSRFSINRSPKFNSLET
jgi:MFS family permease